jgi:hypothetical protein
MRKNSGINATKIKRYYVHHTTERKKNTAY